MTTPGADAFPRAGLDAPFAVPEKKIGSEADVVRFQRSVAFARFMAFIELLNAAVKGKTCLDQDIPSSPTISRLIELLDVLNGLIDEVPPSTGPRRFGNVAFRTWMGKLDERAPTLLREYLPAECHPALVEMTPYFLGGFGSGQRLDYGTGHELSFAAFLCSLFLLRILDPAKDAVATALLIFPKYFSLIRRLVEMYTLEPAGSHGVWGLDDTSFLPFLLGSGQLREEAGAPPTESIMRPEVVEAQKDKNLYFAAIAWINKMKRGPFYEHSPQLYDISGVPYWAKINKGMIKMYKVEVLGKFPVVQHFPIGTVFFPLDEVPGITPAANTRAMGPLQR